MSATGDYEPVYRELQQRTGPGGDLAMAGEYDTKNRHTEAGMWTLQRKGLHVALLERFKEQFKRMRERAEAALEPIAKESGGTHRFVPDDK